LVEVSTIAASFPQAYPQGVYDVIIITPEIFPKSGVSNLQLSVENDRIKS